MGNENLEFLAVATDTSGKGGKIIVYKNSEFLGEIPALVFSKKQSERILKVANEIYNLDYNNS